MSASNRCCSTMLGRPDADRGRMTDWAIEDLRKNDIVGGMV